ncbi:hypothetical protein WJ438_31800 [Streptomyces sp. GD-15H]|uniref:hypothetical protein n=1 Tax=Streptomyces sp. GD-15H TaxID=3129112 RepID=UPI0032457BD9
MPERQAVFGCLTVRENLVLAAPARPRDGFSGDFATRGAAALGACPSCGHCWSAAGTLSGGEQRTAASHGCGRPTRVLLVYEPAQGMSPAAALHACAVIAEQRLPRALRGRPAFVDGPHRGAVVFTGEAGGPGRRA